MNISLIILALMIDLILFIVILVSIVKTARNTELTFKELKKQTELLIFLSKKIDKIKIE